MHNFIVANVKAATYFGYVATFTVVTIKLCIGGLYFFHYVFYKRMLKLISSTAQLLFREIPSSVDPNHL